MSLHPVLWCTGEWNLSLCGVLCCIEKGNLSLRLVRWCTGVETCPSTLCCGAQG